MDKQAFCEVENNDPTAAQKWMDKHGFEEDAEGRFKVDKFEGKVAVEVPQLFENIRVNVREGWYEPLYALPYDERTFVMVCGGPSAERFLDEIARKVEDPAHYLVVCSNMTAGWLLEKGIVPHVHFILDPQAKKRFDVTEDKTHAEIEYWINAACDPSVFTELREQGIKPKVFLADFESEGKAIQTVKESMTPGQPGMMAIQGGTMAGLRAMNLADGLGFRKMEYYGFDATVEIKDGKARPYAYEKKRGEVIIEVSCDKCDAKFDTTLILQKQVNEFLAWRSRMAWMEIEIFGGGLIDHCKKHAEEIEAAKPVRKERFTPAYAAMQKELHANYSYGVAGAAFTPSIFHGICQLAKRLGEVKVLDYGSSSGNTMRVLQDKFWLPPVVTMKCYDPFVEEFSAEPEAADFVLCTDVMEHVEPECTDAVLDHLKALTKRIIFFSISLKPAQKILSDGRNAHINLRSAEWWVTQIRKRFILGEVKLDTTNEVLLVVAQSIQDVAQILKEREAHGST